MAQVSSIVVSTLTASNPTLFVDSSTEVVAATSTVGPSSDSIALTTIFTPSPDCTAFTSLDFAYANDGTTYYSKDGEVTSSSCYPQSYREYQFSGNNWYSPAACPHSYEYVSTGTGGIDRETTLAVCCPSGFRKAGNNFHCTQGNSGSGGATVRMANAISVKWQASDLPLFTPASAPQKALATQAKSILTPALTPVKGLSGNAVSTGSLASLVGVSAGIPGSAPLPSARGSSNKSGDSLSAGAAAGAGVGATLCAIAVICGLLWLFKRYKITARRPKNPQEVDEKVAAYYEVDDVNQRRHLAELEPERHVLEAANNEKPLEADSRSVRLELEGDPGSKLSPKVQVTSDVSSTDSAGR